MFRRIAVLIIASACLFGCGMAPTLIRPEAPRVVYHARKWYVHVASAFSLARYYRILFA